MNRDILVDKKVICNIEIDGQFVIIEDVPSRVDVETGEKYFSPETVERLQKAVWQRCKPVRTIETPVYEFAALTCQ